MWKLWKNLFLSFERRKASFSKIMSSQKWFCLVLLVFIGGLNSFGKEEISIQEKTVDFTYSKFALWEFVKIKIFRCLIVAPWIIFFFVASALQCFVCSSDKLEACSTLHFDGSDKELPFELCLSNVTSCFTKTYSKFFIF